MEPVNNYDFQVLNCPSNDNNICTKDNKKRLCFDCKGFCTIKQQIVNNWVMQNIYEKMNEYYHINICFRDMPKNNIDLLQPCPKRVVLKSEFQKAKENCELEFRKEELKV